MSASKVMRSTLALDSGLAALTNGLLLVWPDSSELVLLLIQQLFHVLANAPCRRDQLFVEVGGEALSDPVEEVPVPIGLLHMELVGFLVEGDELGLLDISQERLGELMCSLHLGDLGEEVLVRLFLGDG